MKLPNYMFWGLPVLVLTLLLSTGCSKSLTLEEVKVIHEDEQIYFIANSDTLSRCPEIKFDENWKKLREVVFPGIDILSLQNRWSCSLLNKNGQDKSDQITSFNELEVALGTVFRETAVSSNMSRLRVNFIAKKLFPTLTLFARNGTDIDAIECEKNYVSQLRLSLNNQSRGEVSPPLFKRGLDSCQIVETIEASNQLFDLQKNEYILTPLECTDHDDGFLINKPYYFISLTDSINATVEIRLLNPMVYFKWIEI